MSSLMNAQGIGGLIFIVLFGGFAIAYFRMWRWVVGPDGNQGDKDS